MSSSSGFHSLWPGSSKRVSGIEARSIDVVDRSPPMKAEPREGPVSGEKAPIAMAHISKEGAHCKGKKRKEVPGQQNQAKRTKQASPWTYPADASEEGKLVQRIREEKSLLLEDLKTGKPIAIESEEAAGSRRATAALIEDSSLPFSTLAQRVLDTVGQSTTPATVRSTILSLAERVNYGVQKADADVLEDDSSESCWRWEVREVKLLNESIRDEVLDRRKCRQKVSERLAALEGLAFVLSKPGFEVAEHKAAFNAAAARLKKLEDREAIVLLAEDLVRKRKVKRQARDAKCAAKEAERAAKAQEKESQKTDKETEKEKQRAEKEAERLRLKEEKERDRAEKEAEKERLRAEKEAQRQEKEAAREKEEAEKERLRAEREALEQKKRAQLKKSAGIMDRFIIKRRPSDAKKEPEAQVEQAKLSHEAEAPGPSNPAGNGESEAAKAMDKELAEKKVMHPLYLKRSYLHFFRDMRSSLKRGPYAHWGIRKAPKKLIQHAIRLAGDPFSALRESRGKANRPDSAKAKRKVILDLSDDDDDMDEADDVIHLNEEIEKAGRDRRRRRYKLLQLGEMGKTCNRPPYYGTWSKKSNAVTGRRPLGLDPGLDYEVDSDEEWEEEDPGESLSSSDKEDNEEDDKNGFGSEDEEDGFLVPAGYLSEDEGIELDSPTPSPAHNGASPPLIDEDLATINRLQRKLEKATKVALKTNKPLIVSALLPPASGDQTGLVYEGNQAFLQAMTVQVLRSDVCIEVPTPTAEEEETASPPGEAKKAAGRPRVTLPDDKIPELIAFLLSSSHGMAKNVELLTAKFPGVPKKQLDQRIREVAEYDGGRWQVKSFVLAQHGLGLPQETVVPAATPVIGQDEAPKPRLTPRVLPITNFFSKVSGGSNQSGKSHENSKDAQSEKSPLSIDEGKKGSQEAKSVLLATGAD